VKQRVSGKRKIKEAIGDQGKSLQSSIFLAKETRLGQFLLYVLFLIRMKMYTGSCLDCERLNFRCYSRFLDFSRNRLAAHELPPGGTYGYTHIFGFADEPPGGWR